MLVSRLSVLKNSKKQKKYFVSPGYWLQSQVAINNNNNQEMNFLIPRQVDGDVSLKLTDNFQFSNPSQRAIKKVAKDLIASLLREYERVLGRRMRPSGGTARNKAMIKILANSLFTRGENRNDVKWIEYRRDNTGENSLLVDAIDVLNDCDYIDCTTRYSSARRSDCSIFCPKDSLLELLIGIEKPVYRPKKLKRVELVTFSHKVAELYFAEDGTEKKIKRTRQTDVPKDALEQVKLDKSFLVRLNNYRKDTVVELCGVRMTGIEASKKYCNADFRQYGRYHNVLQNIKNHTDGIDNRLLAKIDGEVVAEVDLKNSHLLMMYLLTSSNFPSGDLYAIDNTTGSRSSLKFLTMLLINCNKQGAKTAARNHFNGVSWADRKKVKILKNDYDTVEAVLDDMELIRCHHVEVADWFNIKNLGTKLMKLEANIMQLAMTRLMDEGLIFFDIHDSLLVKKSDADKVAYEFRLAYSNIGYDNHYPGVSIEYVENGVVQEKLIEPHFMKDYSYGNHALVKDLREIIGDVVGQHSDTSMLDAEQMKEFNAIDWVMFDEQKVPDEEM